MRIRYISPLFVFILFILPKIIFAAPEQIKSNITLEQIKAAYKKRNFEETVKLSQDYLNNVPKDTDVALYKGLALSQLKQCNKAIPVFNSILDSYPQYLDARLGLIHCLLKNHSDTQALDVIEKGLNLEHNNNELLFLKAKTLLSLGKKRGTISTLHNNLRIHPEDKQSKILLRNIKAEEHQKDTPKRSTDINADNSSKKVMRIGRNTTELIRGANKPPKFIAGIYTDNMGINVPKQYWNYSNFYGYWVNSLGAFGGSVNYASRLNQNATQMELDAYPNLGKYFTLDLTYAFANKPELFPDELESGELHAYLPYEIDASFGGAHRKISHYTLNSVTGSLNKFIGNYYFTFRPIHFVPGSGPKSNLFRFGVRRYGDDPNQYIGLVLMDGTSPDLTDLLSVDFIKIRDRLVFFEAQQPINKTISIQYGVGYEEMVYPNQFLRTLIHFNLGLKAGFL